MNIRALVVGTGSISGRWFEALAAERVQVAAVVEPRAGVAEQRQARWGFQAPVYRNLEEALERHADADFLLDLTPPEVHARITCAALRAGLHVLGEKPMADDMETARDMVRTSEETGRLYMVSQTRRWHIPHDRARRTVRKGCLGPLVDVHCDFFQTAPVPGFRREMDSPLLLDMAIHHFDLARFLTGADPVAVRAFEYQPRGAPTTGPAAALCLFEMTGGIAFTYRGQWFAEGCSTGWNGAWRLVGTEGSLLMNKDQGVQGERAARDAQGVRVLEPLPIAGSSLRHEYWRGALRAMLRFLATGEKPPTECHDNLLSLAMVYAAMCSARKGQRVMLSELPGVKPPETRQTDG